MTAGHDHSGATADQITGYFDDLARPGHHAAFEGASATLRVEVTGGEEQAGPWYLTIAGGEVSVTRRDDPADTVIRLSPEAAAGLISGRLNAHAAMLRGMLTIEGKIAPAMMFQRCLPGPPGSTGRVPPISSQEVTARHAGGEDRGDIPLPRHERRHGT